MLNEKQVQKSGDNSLNIQGRDIFIQSGVNYADARQIALDVFQSNFVTLSEEARKVATERAEEITEDFLKRLIIINPNGILLAQNADFQYSLYNAQREYAKTGDIDLKELLVATLINRTTETERSTLQVILNEAINIIPKLTQSQLNLLSIHIIFTKLNYPLGLIGSIKEFVYRYEELLSPLCIHAKQMDFEHLQYCSCVGISMGSISIRDILIDKYGGLFSVGFEENLIAQMGIDRNKYPQLFAQCHNNISRLQINALNEDQLLSFIPRFNIDGESYRKLLELYKNYLMNSSSIRALLSENSSLLTKIYDLWEGTSLKSLRLTTMGIALGQLNLKRHHPDFPISLERLLY